MISSLTSSIYSSFKSSIYNLTKWVYNGGKIVFLGQPYGGALYDDLYYIFNLTWQGTVALNIKSQYSIKTKGTLGTPFEQSPKILNHPTAFGWNYFAAILKVNDEDCMYRPYGEEKYCTLATHKLGKGYVSVLSYNWKSTTVSLNWRIMLSLSLNLPYWKPWLKMYHITSYVQTLTFFLFLLCILL